VEFWDSSKPPVNAVSLSLWLTYSAFFQPMTSTAHITCLPTASLITAAECSLLHIIQSTPASMPQHFAEHYRNRRWGDSRLSLSCNPLVPVDI
jgi:hypothetical protein